MVGRYQQYCIPKGIKREIINFVNYHYIYPSLNSFTKIVAPYEETFNQLHI